MIEKLTTTLRYQAMRILIWLVGIVTFLQIVLPTTIDFFLGLIVLFFIGLISKLRSGMKPEDG